MAVLNIDVTSREPFAGGQAFGDSGAYEELKGTLTYGVDPAHAANAGIVDLQYAPRDAAGLVRFRSDFAILSRSMRQGATAGCWSTSSTAGAS